MSPSLLRFQGPLSHAEALELAKQAPSILRNNPKSFSSSPLQSLFTSPETPELWLIYENLLLACLRTGDDESAHFLLERLDLRFGGDNHRLMALRGLSKEASAEDDSALEAVLKEYDTVLKQLGNGTTNIPIAKRRVALAKTLGRTSEAIESLVKLLEYTQTDAESWSELADLYLSQGMYPQAIYALEEVLVISPNAWNMQARLGEVLYMAVTSGGPDGAKRYLAESLKRFCRSIELCDDYLRGYYGLKLVTDNILSDPGKAYQKPDPDSVSLPERTTVEALNEKATQKLAEIVRRNGAKEASWQGYDEAEIAAAKEVLDKASPVVVR